MNETIKQQNDFTGVTAWHNAGWTGKGVRIWNMEDTTDHGRGTRQRILDAAPDAEVTSAAHSIVTEKGRIKEESVTENGKKLTADQFCNHHGFHIVSASLGGPANPSEERIELYRNIREKYNLTMHNSAGNDGSSGVHGGRIPESEAIYVGACMAFKQNYNDLRMWNYSSIGDEKDEVDFSTFTGGLSGTSFSCPYLAGTTALLMQRYGTDMTELEVYRYYQMIAKPIPTGHTWESGYDLWSGYGVPILPDPTKRLVRMKIGDKSYKIDKTVETMDTAPFIDGGRTFVPVAFAALAVGATVKWDGVKKTVTINKNGQNLIMTIGNKSCLLNGKPYQMDVAPFIKDSRTFVPVAFVALGLGCKVTWVESEKKVMILEA